MDLFAPKEPLAYRMRPRNLSEFVGQEHILGEGKLLRRAIQADQLGSLIFYGPPGTGKTTLARIIAKTTQSRFKSINAVLAGVKDIREGIQEAEGYKKQGFGFLLFVDEVHRFNKSQQDALLPHVENGTITLIGATTENPFFEVNKALLSRSRIFELKSLGREELLTVAQRALEDERGYGSTSLELEAGVLDHIVQRAGGDARLVLNALELAIEPKLSEQQPIHITLKDAEESIQKKALLYDKDGDAHFDTISAFIKSVRGSDPDAALYWLAKMLQAGEDPRYLFRRMLILASEDVGLADPHALGVVTGAARAFEYVGLPEGRYHLAQACLYLCLAPKSNSTKSFFEALDCVQESREDDVPNHLKDISRDKQALGHGQGYQYPHDFPGHWVVQSYLPESLKGKRFYTPGEEGWEGRIASYLRKRRGEEKE